MKVSTQCLVVTCFSADTILTKETPTMPTHTSNCMNMSTMPFTKAVELLSCEQVEARIKEAAAQLSISVAVLASSCFAARHKEEAPVEHCTGLTFLAQYILMKPAAMQCWCQSGFAQQ